MALCIAWKSRPADAVRADLRAARRDTTLGLGGTALRAVPFFPITRIVDTSNGTAAVPPIYRPPWKSGFTAVGQLVDFQGANDEHI